MNASQKTRLGSFIIVIVLLAVAGVAFGPWIRKEYLANTFEERAKKQLTVQELQVWVTNLLATGKLGKIKVQDAGPAFPSRMTNLYPKLPSIYVYENDDRNPGRVTVTWGGGMIGSWGFHIGPTNLVTEGNQWAPGVFFMPRDSR